MGAWLWFSNIRVLFSNLVSGFSFSAISFTVLSRSYACSLYFVQVLVPIFFSKMTRPKILRIRMMLLNLFLLLQYVPRVLRIYLSWRKHIMSFKYARRVWIKVLFNIFLYILASHVSLIIPCILVLLMLN
jgi:hypothetical protein